MTADNGISVPDPDEMISAFGCEYRLDDDIYEKYEFADSVSSKLTITFGKIDGSFGLSFTNRAGHSLKIYDEFLSSASIDEQTQTVEVALGDSLRAQSINIKVWPIFDIQIVSMK